MTIGQSKWRFMASAGVAPAALTVGLCVLIGLLQGCSVGPIPEQGQEADKMAMPPDIPEPPMSLGDATDPESPQARLVYQDVIDFELQLLSLKPDEGNALTYEKLKFKQSQGLAFIHAVQEAVRRQVLTPPPYDEHQPVYFEPQVPVVYQDFYTWLLGFADARPRSGEQANATGFEGKAPTLSEEGWELETGPESLSEEEALQRFGVSLPLEASDDAQSVLPGDTVSREMLCYLYARLSRQQNKAKRLTAADIEQASSGKSKIYSLQNIQDRSNISPWAAKYVALAYQDGFLKNVFGLTPTAMVNGQGLQPKKAVTRSEAITFLYQFFSSHTFKVLPTSSPPPPIERSADPAAATEMDDPEENPTN